MKSRSATYIGFIWAPIEKEAIIKDHLANFHTTEFNKWRTNENEENKGGMQQKTHKVYKTNTKNQTMLPVTKCKIVSKLAPCAEWVKDTVS